MTTKMTYLIGILNLALFLGIAFLATGCSNDYLSEYKIDKLATENADFSKEVKIHRIEYSKAFFSIPLYPNAWHEMTDKERWEFRYKRDRMQSKAFDTYKSKVFQSYVKHFGQTK